MEENYEFNTISECEKKAMKSIFSSIIKLLFVNIIIFIISVLFLAENFNCFLFVSISFSVLIIPSIILSIDSYIKILAFKRFIKKNNLDAKINEIKFWRNGNYILTENYIFLIKLKSQYINYNDIVKIDRTCNLILTRNIHTVHIIKLYLKNTEIYSFKIYSSEENKNIIDFISSKNKNIIVNEEVHRIRL